jgi:hypothetical protein
LDVRTNQTVRLQIIPMQGVYIASFLSNFIPQWNKDKPSGATDMNPIAFYTFLTLLNRYDFYLTIDSNNQTQVVPGTNIVDESVDFQDLNCAYISINASILTSLNAILDNGFIGIYNGFNSPIGQADFTALCNLYTSSLALSSTQNMISFIAAVNLSYTLILHQPGATTLDNNRFDEVFTTLTSDNLQPIQFLDLATSRRFDPLFLTKLGTIDAFWLAVRTRAKLIYPKDLTISFTNFIQLITTFTNELKSNIY